MGERTWRVVPVNDPKTIATAIACGDPIDGIAALEAIWESGGEALRVSDDERFSARDILARNGIFVEPSGAVAYAGILKKKLEGTVVAVATGHGSRICMELIKSKKRKLNL